MSFEKSSLVVLYRMIFVLRWDIFHTNGIFSHKLQANIDWSREKFSLVGSKPDWAGIERVSRLIRREHSTFSIYSSHVDPVVSLSTLIKTAPHIQTSKSLSQERSQIIKSLKWCFGPPKISQNGPNRERYNTKSKGYFLLFPLGIKSRLKVYGPRNLKIFGLLANEYRLYITQTNCLIMINSHRPYIFTGDRIFLDRGRILSTTVLIEKA